MSKMWRRALKVALVLSVGLGLVAFGSMVLRLAWPLFVLLPPFLVGVLWPLWSLWRRLRYVREQQERRSDAGRDRDAHEMIDS